MSMIEHLDRAVTASTDEPDHQPIALGQRIRTGHRGRPAVHIEPEQLSGLSIGRTTRTSLEGKFHCCARTIRRRLVKYGISLPGQAPLFQTTVAGETVRPEQAGACADLSAITEEELDLLVLDIHTQFPSFGRRLIDGCLLQLGYRIPRQRLQTACLRVLGTSNRQFGPRRLFRRVYSVPGPNSLWHHDGQHG